MLYRYGNTELKVYNIHVLSQRFEIPYFVVKMLRGANVQYCIKDHKTLLILT